jgi:hypothetical protein
MDTMTGEACVCNSVLACVQKGMSGPDFEEYRRRKPELTAQTAASTLKLEGDVISTGAAAEEGGTLVSVDVEKLKAQLSSMQDQHVVYVSDVFAVAQQGRSGKRQGSCVPNCDYEAMQAGLRKKLEKFESMAGCYPFHDQFLPPLSTRLAA